MRGKRTGSIGIAIAALLLAAAPSVAVGQERSVPVDDEVLHSFQASPTAGYVIQFHERADLSPADSMEWIERGRFVVEALRQVADNAQPRVRAHLDGSGAQFESFWIDNVIVVQASDLATFEGLQQFDEISALRAIPEIHRIDPVDAIEAPELSPMAPEPNLNHVNAPDVWSLGFAGEGMVLGVIDGGPRHTHNALVNAYRGHLGGGSFDHAYNWWDPASNSATPHADFHGTHVAGIMVGDDGNSNQTGIAPGAQWIACELFPAGTLAAALTCGEFMLAPWDAGGGNEDPDLRPHAVNNSWGDCNPFFQDFYEGITDSWRAAGIMPIFAAGNSGPPCNRPALTCGQTTNAGRYGSVVGVGSTSQTGGTPSSFSLWGPTDNPNTINPLGFPTIKPNISAPGGNIRSTLASSDTAYGNLSGTSMASPHVAGLIALLWQAAPCLVGDYAQTGTLLMEKVVPIAADTQCGGEGPGNVPNHHTGWGEIDALAIVTAGLAFCGGAQGTIEGTVTRSDTSAPLDGAQVQAVGTATFSATTDADGFYEMTVLEGTYDVTASLDGFESETVDDVEVSEDGTEVVDFSLVPLVIPPAIEVEPTSLSSTLEQGQTEIHELTLANLGDETLEWEVTEESGRAGHATSGRGTATSLVTGAEPAAADSGSGLAAGPGSRTAIDLATLLGGPLPGIRPIHPAGGGIDCDDEPGIIIHDDGTVENGYSGDPDVVNEVIFVDQFTPSSYPATFSAVCLAFLTQGPTTLDFELVVYADDGAGGGPGTELGALAVTATGIPGSLTVVWSSFDISSLGVVIDSGSAYIGARWAPADPGVFIAVDQSTDRPVGFAGGYWWNDNANAWQRIHEAGGVFASYRALFVRAVEGEVEPLDCTLPDWVGVDPTDGSVLGGESQMVAVTFDSTGLSPGNYEATLCLASNDPERPLVTVPLALTVEKFDGPVLTLDPSSLDFGEVDLGETSPPLTSTLENSGIGEATGLDFSTTDGGFDADASACGDNLPAGESCLVRVTFTPTTAGPAAATLEATSAEGASAALDLSGVGVPAVPVFTATALLVDSEALTSDGNQVFEPGELIEVSPSWRNDDLSPRDLTGTASDFTGPGDADYILQLGTSDYGVVEPGQSASCLDTGACYQLGVDDPFERPATRWVATFDENLSDGTEKTWTLHIGDSFADVPRESPFYRSIETMLHHEVTGGCSVDAYCPADGNTRGQMPVFVLRAFEGRDFEPEACVPGDEAFTDVPATSGLCPWIQELSTRGVVAGCGENLYCPDEPVNRQQMAIFLLRTLEGDGYTPPPCRGEFADMPCTSPFAAWVEDLFDRDITGGCGTEPLEYCPTNPVNRQQMAVFVSETFGLILYGP